MFINKQKLHKHYTLDNTKFIVHNPWCKLQIANNLFKDTFIIVFLFFRSNSVICIITLH